MAWKSRVNQIIDNPVFTDSVIVNIEFYDDDQNRKFVKEFKLSSIHFQSISDFDTLIEQKLQELVRFDNVVAILRERVGRTPDTEMVATAEEVLQSTEVSSTIIEQLNLDTTKVTVADIPDKPVIDQGNDSIEA